MISYWGVDHGEEIAKSGPQPAGPIRRKINQERYRWNAKGIGLAYKEGKMTRSEALNSIGTHMSARNMRNAGHKVKVSDKHSGWKRR